MRVLIAGEDLFSAVGGGQSFFRGYVAGRREQFVSFRSAPDENAAATNVATLHLPDLHRQHDRRFSLADVELPFGGGSLYGKEFDVLRVLDMAAAVRGEAFDVVEIPDFLPFGALLPHALRYHGVRVERVMVSMHGTLSDGLADNWPGQAVGDLTTLRYLEQLVFRASHVRYGISTRYIAEWERLTGIPGDLLDPLAVMPIEGFSRGRSWEPNPEVEVPDLCFVGRQDKWKGPDVFVNLCSNLPREIYGDAVFIGPEVNLCGHNSMGDLRSIAERRGLVLRHLTLSREQVLRRFSRDPMVTIAPSRRDTFNLVAFESLLSGCPTAISTGCGVTDFLDVAFPNAPWLRLTPTDPNGVLEQLQRRLADYEGWRADIKTYLDRTTPVREGLSREALYQLPSKPDQRAVDESADLFDRIMFEVDKRGRAAVTSTMATRLEQRTTAFSTRLGCDGSRFLELFSVSNRLAEDLEEHARGAQQPAPLHAIVAMAARLGRHSWSGDRAPAFALLALLERARGNELLYANYMIRHMRLTGRSTPALLREVQSILAANRHSEEAKVLPLLYGKPAKGEVYKYLQNQLTAFSALPDKAGDEVVESRKAGSPKISVIVSIYNGADKVDFFFRQLCRATPAALATMEVIFVDSASPDGTRASVLKVVEAAKLGPRLPRVVYVRSKARETIQRAWNRALTYARGEYLSLLGLDEGNRPDGFELMADYLDRNPDVDWVQGNAIIVDTNSAGAYVGEVMPYRREFPTQDFHYLDTCYIGFVGSLYRRSIHERVGYFDELFRGAGDTEFKNRALPHITVETIPEQMGVFFNFPEARTTQSWMAELEDLRAWYLYRTSEGMRYALENRSVEDAAALLRHSLSYRKSYMDQQCTDIELASALCTYLASRGSAGARAAAPYAPAVTKLLAAYRVLDDLNGADAIRGIGGIQARLTALETAVDEIQTTTDALRFGTVPDFKATFTNDNRSHQHIVVWTPPPPKLGTEQPLNVGDLAGPQDLAELVSSCLSEAEDVDLDSAWRTGRLAQVKRLFDAPAVDVWIPPAPAVPGIEQSVAQAVRVVAQTQLRTARPLAVFVGARREDMTLAFPGKSVFFTGRITNTRPALAAARVVAFPFFDEQAAVFTEVVARALVFEKVVLATPGIRAALTLAYPQVDLHDLDVSEDERHFRERLAVLVEDREARIAGVAAAARIARNLREHLKVAPPPPAAASSPLEWDSTIVNTNRALRKVLEKISPAEGLADLDSMAQDVHVRPLVDRIIGALLVERDAPILGTSQDFFRALARLPACTTLDDALAVLGQHSEAAANPRPGLRVVPAAG